MAGGSSKWYREIYLTSDHWRNYRRRKLERFGYRCFDCDKRAVDVHHEPKDYACLWREDVERNCVCLCRSCHDWRHGVGDPIAHELKVALRSRAEPDEPSEQELIEAVNPCVVRGKQCQGKWDCEAPATHWDSETKMYFCEECFVDGTRVMYHD